MQLTTSQANGALTNGSLEQARFIDEALGLPIGALAYRVGRALAERFADRAIIESFDCDFDVEGFAQAGHCALTPRPEVYAELLTSWDGYHQRIYASWAQGWHSISWEGQRFELLSIEWPSGYGKERGRWLIAETAEAAAAFFRAVCLWSSDVDESILVFQDGYWAKSEELFAAIKGASYENLVLGGSLKEELFADMRAFFGAKEVYGRAGIPWKRGIVLIGPPGNGKTHAVKALINDLGQSCLYVKSLSTENADDHHHIRSVFAKAREAAPCLLVLEDLDSLITDHNRSFFLNELDGFASNEGIVTIASTNHPERLDPAIMNRPSRFDRKYHFPLPSLADRRAYLELWNGRMEPAMQVGAATVGQVAEASEGFSFAYVKELIVSATIRWAHQQVAGSMDAIMLAQLDELRSQMVSEQE
jgi:hypothetical protein